MKWIKERDRFELSRKELNELVDLIGVIDRNKKYQKVYIWMERIINYIQESRGIIS